VALFRSQSDFTTLDLLDECGANVQRTAVLLRDLLVDYPEHAGLATQVRQAEQEGDRIAHDIIHRLNGVGGGNPNQVPFSATDGYMLATALDDIVDHAEHAADCLGLYGVEAPMEQAVAMADILVLSADQVALALRALRTDSELGPALVEIHRLENEADRVSREAIASLFIGGIDPMVVIRWKDIFETLEASVDACESVAHVLEGITLRNA
jgi:uncharacterized protein Yka (UPF0111/DUF47 family)